MFDSIDLTHTGPLRYFFPSPPPNTVYRVCLSHHIIITQTEMSSTVIDPIKLNLDSENSQKTLEYLVVSL